MSEKIEIPEMFQYVDVPTPEDCIHKISPSQISKFFEYPRLYYEERIQGKESDFQGNTSSVLGTINHHIFKCVALGKEVKREDINEQLKKYSELKPELNLDLNEIMTNYPLVAEVVVNDYILKSTASLVKVEEQVLIQVDDGIYLGGTYDRLEGDCIVDYKNVGTKPNENAIPFNYKIQLLSYAYALRKLGHEVNRIRLVYGVRPTKTIGARCIVVTESIDYVAEKLINDTIKLISESVIICHNRPELIHLIFKSMDLKR